MVGGWQVKSTSLNINYSSLKAFVFLQRQHIIIFTCIITNVNIQWLGWMAVLCDNTHMRQLTP